MAGTVKAGRGKLDPVTLEKDLRGGRAGCFLLALILLAAPPALSGQASAAPSSPAFEVASIRPHLETSDNHSHLYSSARDGEFRAVNVSVKLLVQTAYGLPETRIVGGPKWFGTARFDMEAKSEDAVNGQLRALDSDQARLVKQGMLQGLLAERFQLRVHRETRDLPVYDLVVAKGGAKLIPSKADGTTLSTGRGKMVVQGSDHTVALLAEQLATLLGRVVVDRTGMEGRYAISLTWTPEDASPEKVEASGPSLFTAIEEQLGLKLEPRKAMVEVLVVDQVTEPTAN